MRSQRQNQQSQGIHSSTSVCLYIYYSYLFTIFMGLLFMRMGVSLTLVLPLGTNFLHWDAVSSFNVIVFPWSYYIILHHVWLLSFRSLFFSYEKSSGSEGNERGVDLGGVEGIEIIIKNILQKNLFPIIEEYRKTEHNYFICFRVSSLNDRK